MRYNHTTMTTFDSPSKAALLTRRQMVASTLACVIVFDSNVGEESAGWEKSSANPVLGGSLGTCFDICVVKLGAKYWMYFSWRPMKSVAVVESVDGVHWTIPTAGPQIVLGPFAESGWEDNINRPVVLEKDGLFHMWYTGQTAKHSAIGHATSTDGIRWTRANASHGAAVLTPTLQWEGVAVMTPHVLWEPDEKLYKMWYSAGEQYEPNAIGYATSLDGIAWTRYSSAPTMVADPGHAWEGNRVTAPCVVKDANYYYAFYIGFKDINTAAIGVARSRDGVTNWTRHPENPVIRPSRHGWDAEACYKPSVIHERGRWMLWYNGRRGTVEQIGLAIHQGDDLHF